MNHPCAGVFRIAQRQNKDVQVGYLAFTSFYAKKLKHKNVPTIENFEKSKFYTTFVKFGRYVISNDIPDRTKFIDWLIMSDFRVDDWTKPVVLAKWTTEFTRTESYDKAIERCLDLFNKWAAENGAEYQNFFKEIRPSRAVSWILSGKLSPWSLYIFKSAVSLLDRLDDEQMKLIETTIDPVIWKKKLSLVKSEINTYTQEFEKLGL